VYDLELLTTNLIDIIKRLEHKNSLDDILILMVIEIIFWGIFSLFLTLFLPNKYNHIDLKYLYSS